MPSAHTGSPARVAPDGVAIRGVGRGHEAIRASHRKTLELAREEQIGPRATCVVAVGVRLDEASVVRLGGWVDLAIAAGGIVDVVRARVNPAFRPGDPLVVRRAGATTRDALLIDAEKSAADLDRRLVDALATAGGTVELILRPTPHAPAAPGTLLVWPGARWEGEAPGGAAAALVLRSPLGDAEAKAALDELGAGARVELAASVGADPIAARLIADAHDRGHTVLPGGGLSPVAAVLAVAGVAGASVLVADVGSPVVRPKSCAPGLIVVAVGRADAVLDWLKGWSAQPGARGALGFEVGSPREQWLSWRASQRPAAPRGGDRLAVAAVGDVETGGRGALPAATEPLARALAARGVSTRDLAALLRESAGLRRREAYEAALSLTEARRKR